VAGVFVLGGVVLTVLALIGQVYPWLKTGYWPDMTIGPIARPIVADSGFYKWYIGPDSWYGLHTLVRFVWDLPLLVWIICCAVATFVLARE
jgi:hypothetical protein